MSWDELCVYIFKASNVSHQICFILNEAKLSSWFTNRGQPPFDVWNLEVNLRNFFSKHLSLLYYVTMCRQILLLHVSRLQINNISIFCNGPVQKCKRSSFVRFTRNNLFTDRLCLNDNNITCNFVTLNKNIFLYLHCVYTYHIKFEPTTSLMIIIIIIVRE